MSRFGGLYAVSSQPQIQRKPSQVHTAGSVTGDQKERQGRVRMEGTRFFSLACVRSSEFKPQRPWRTEERNGGRKASREEAAFQSPRKNSLGSENTQPHSALRNRCGGPYIESYRTLCRQKFLSYRVLSSNHTEV